MDEWEEQPYPGPGFAYGESMRITGKIRFRPKGMGIFLNMPIYIEKDKLPVGERHLLGGEALFMCLHGWRTCSAQDQADLIRAHVATVRKSRGEINHFIAYNHYMKGGEGHYPYVLAFDSEYDYTQDDIRAGHRIDPVEARIAILTALEKCFLSRTVVREKGLFMTLWETACSDAKFSLHFRFLTLRTKDAAMWSQLIEFVNAELAKTPDPFLAANLRLDKHPCPLGGTPQLRACLCDKWKQLRRGEDDGPFRHDPARRQEPAYRPLLPMTDRLVQEPENRQALVEALDNPLLAVYYLHGSHPCAGLPQQALRARNSILKTLALAHDSPPLRLEDVLVFSCPDPQVGGTLFPNAEWPLLEDKVSRELRSFAQEQRRVNLQVIVQNRHAQLAPEGLAMGLVMPSLLHPPAYTMPDFARRLSSVATTDVPPYRNTMRFLNQHMVYVGGQKLVLQKVLDETGAYLLQILPAPGEGEERPVAGLVTTVEFRTEKDLAAAYPAPELLLQDSPEGGDEEAAGSPQAEGGEASQNSQQAERSPSVVRAKRKRKDAIYVPAVVYWLRNARRGMGNVPVRAFVQNTRFFPSHPRIHRENPDKPICEYAEMPGTVDYFLNTYCGQNAYRFYYPDGTSLRSVDWRDIQSFPIPLQSLLFSAYFTACGGDMAVWDCYIKILASMLQRPDVPSDKMLLTRGEQGSGKTEINKAICEQLVGPAHGLFATDPKVAVGKHADNSGKIMVFLDECSFRQEDIQQLNAAVTGRQRTIEPKYVQQKTASNYAQFFLATNNKNALEGITQNARRFILAVCVHFCMLKENGADDPAVARLQERFVTSLARVVKKPNPVDDAAAISAHPERSGASEGMWQLGYLLMYAMNVDRWVESEHYRPAPTTKEMKRLVNLNKGIANPVQRFVEHMLSTASNMPDSVIPGDREKRTEFTSKHALFAGQTKWFRFVPVNVLFQWFTSLTSSNRGDSRRSIDERTFNNELPTLMPGCVYIGFLRDIVQEQPAAKRQMDLADGADDYLDAVVAWFAKDPKSAQEASGLDTVFSTSQNPALSEVPADYLPADEPIRFDDLPAFMKGGPFGTGFFLPADVTQNRDAVRFCLYKYAELADYFKTLCPLHGEQEPEQEDEPVDMPETPTQQSPFVGSQLHEEPSTRSQEEEAEGYVAFSPEPFSPLIDINLITPLNSLPPSRAVTPPIPVHLVETEPVVMENMWYTPGQQSHPATPDPLFPAVDEDCIMVDVDM